MVALFVRFTKMLLAFTTMIMLKAIIAMFMVIVTIKVIY